MVLFLYPNLPKILEEDGTVAKKKKNTLPSGNIRIQVYDYTDVDGKKHYKSFTAPTRQEAKYLAAQWKAGKADKKPSRITLYEAVSRYIEAKEGVLSPSTIKEYLGMQKRHMKDVGRIWLDELNTTDVQIWISNKSKNLSPKSVRNLYGLLSAAIEMFAPDLHIKVSLPEKKRLELYCPSDDDVKTLLRQVAGTDLEIAILLAAFGPLRRGEICALDASDISGNKVSVTKSMVMGSDHQWHIKQPKTYGSYRTIEFPDFVIDKLKGKTGRIINRSPDAITRSFERAIKRTSLPHFRFHDLRHYAASIMHAIGVPDQYILQRGGWSSDNVMKTVYRNTIDIETVRQNKKINEHFDKIACDIPCDTFL